MKKVGGKEQLVGTIETWHYRDGNLLSCETSHNRIVDGGLNKTVDIAFDDEASTYWYKGSNDKI